MAIDKGKKKSSSVIAVNQESYPRVQSNVDGRGTTKIDITLPSKKPVEPIYPTLSDGGNKISFPRNKLKKKK